MLEILLSAHLLVPPDLDWSARKRLLRARVSEVVERSNEALGRQDDVPQLTFARLRGRHGEYDHQWHRITLDLESVHDPEKFWHVYRVTVTHEWGHALNGRIRGKRGHGQAFQETLFAMKVGHE